MQASRSTEPMTDVDAWPKALAFLKVAFAQGCR
jgi:hypothetical protein